MNTDQPGWNSADGFRRQVGPSASWDGSAATGFWLSPCPSGSIRVHRWLLLFAWLFGSSAYAADTNALLKSWLESQKELKTWTADLTQTRHLKALAEPLKAEGKIWFSAPDKFRWELGQPARTVAIRNGPDMWLLSPKLKRAEHFPLDGSATGPWRDAMALLESGFPRDATTFRAQYELRAFTRTNDLYQLDLIPRQPAAREMIPSVGVVFSIETKNLVATELTLADGSVLRNDFRNVRVNPEITPSTFAAPDTGEYKITEPWKKRP
jgi:outer membrane lipoprotein-sorting protein